MNINGIQLFLQIYYLIFVAVVLVWRIRSVKKKTGINPAVILRATGVEKITSLYIKVTPYVITGMIIIYSFFDPYYHYLAPIFWLNHGWIQWGGVGLLLLSLLVIVLAQHQMKASFRIGVDKNIKTDLITAGLFSLSRNPIFVGIKLNMIGFFMVLPNALSLAVCVLEWFFMDIQVVLEEAQMMKNHPDAFSDYCKRVRRWL